jgi:hypothetical protein
MLKINIKNFIINNNYLTFVITWVIIYLLFYKWAPIFFLILSMILITVYFYYFSKRCINRIWKIILYLNFAPLLFYALYFSTFSVKEKYSLVINIVLEYELTVLFFFIIMVSVIFTLLFRHQTYFLDRLKISTRVNTAVFLIITSSLVFYAYSINDFDKFFKPESLYELEKFNITPRTAFLTLTQFIVLPYLIANSLLIALIEYLQFRKKEKSNLHWKELL